MVSDFNKKQKDEKSLSKIIFQITGTLLIIILLVLVIADFRMYKKKKELILQIDNYKEKIEKLKESNETLEEEIINADNIDYLEKIAYEQLGQQKPGEKEVIFVQPEEVINEDIVIDDSLEATWFGWLTSKFSWMFGRK